MRSANILVASAAIVALGACTAAPPAPAMPTDADRQALTDLVANVEQLYNAQDAAGLAALVSDDYVSIRPDGTRVEGRAAYEAALNEDFADPFPEGSALQIELAYTQFHGADTATIGGPWSVTGLPEGASLSGSWLVVVTRNGDQWLMTNALVATFVPDEMSEGGN